MPTESNKLNFCKSVPTARIPQCRGTQGTKRKLRLLHLSRCKVEEQCLSTRPYRSRCNQESGFDRLLLPRHHSTILSRPCLHKSGRFQQRSRTRYCKEVAMLRRCSVPSHLTFCLCLGCRLERCPRKVCGSIEENTVDSRGLIHVPM